MGEWDLDTDDLEEVVAREPVLATLATGPHHRQELQDELDLSKTTCHRIVSSFDEKGLLRRTDDGYELTAVGKVVAGELDRFGTNVQVARRLQPLVASFEPVTVSLDVELFADATVTRAQPNDPYPPINRFMELVRQSGSLRSLDRTSIAPLYVEELFDRYLGGDFTVQSIYPRSVIDKLVTEYPDLHRRAAAHGRLEYRVFDDLPFGMSLFDDHVGLRAYDPGTGALLLFADTDAPAAVAWAERVFEHYRDRSTPLSAFEEFPDWTSDLDAQL